MAASKAELERYEKVCREQWRAVSRSVWPVEEEDDEKAQELYQQKAAKGRLYEALVERGRTEADRVMIDAADAFCVQLCRHNHLALAGALHTIACGRWPALSEKQWDKLCTLAAHKKLGGIFDNKYHSRDVLAHFLLFLTIQVMGQGDPVMVDISAGDTGYNILVLGSKIDDANPWRPVLQGSFLVSGKKTTPVTLYLAANLASFVYEFETDKVIMRYAIPFGAVLAPGPAKSQQYDQNLIDQEEREAVKAKAEDPFAGFAEEMLAGIDE